MGGVKLLAVRSSSSMEDLAGQAGAGLYDSVLGVHPTPVGLKNALKTVYCSLFTERAVLSRGQLNLD